MTEKLKDISPEDRFNKFNTMMKGAYVARGDISTLNTRTKADQYSIEMQEALNSSSIGLSEGKINSLREIERQLCLTGQLIQHGVHTVSNVTKLSPLATKEDVLCLAHSLATGESTPNVWATHMIDDINNMGKSRSSYNVWADEIHKKILDDYNTINQQDMQENEFSDVINTRLPITNKYFRPVSPKDEKGHGKEACKVGDGKMEYNEEPVFAENERADSDESFKETNDTLELEDMSSVTKSKFFLDDNKKSEPEKWAKRDANMERLAEALYETLVGRIGKRNSNNPSKRLNMRAITSGSIDNIYRSTVPLGGKHLNINLILDTSGSMYGSYINDGVDVINCINKLAQRGVISGNLMLSASGGSAMIRLPVNDDLLPRISAHNGGEGFRHTMGLRWKELKEADYNVAITDGMLTDGYIDMKEMGKEGIEIVGLYSNRNLKDNKSEALKYSGSLKRWFSNSAVRSSAEEMVYYLIDNSILSYDANPRRTA